MGLAGLTGHVECAKTQRFCKMTDLTGLTGLTGHAEVDFGVREMYKNPTLWTTLTGLTGLTGFGEPCGWVNANSRGTTFDDFDGFDGFDG